MSNLVSKVPKKQADKIQTYAGKTTARVTKTYRNVDGTTIKATIKINKDGTITEKIERRKQLV